MRKAGKGKNSISCVPVFLIVLRVLPTSCSKRVTNPCVPLSCFRLSFFRDSHFGDHRGPYLLPSLTQNAYFACFFTKIDHSAVFCRLMKKGKSALPLHFLVELAISYQPPAFSQSDGSPLAES
jgi:hypothetical protein